MHTSLHRPFANHRGMSRADVLAALACVVVAIAALFPLLGAVGSQSGEAHSLANLRVLAMSNEAYSATFDQRQPTFMPEDAGLVNGNCSAYIATIACPPQVILGTSPSGALWGYFLGSGGLCAGFGYSGSWGNWVVY